MTLINGSQKKHDVGIATIKHPFLMVGIPPIYCDKWGMAYGIATPTLDFKHQISILSISRDSVDQYCYTHINGLP